MSKVQYSVYHRTTRSRKCSDLERESCRASYYAGLGTCSCIFQIRRSPYARPVGAYVRNLVDNGTQCTEKLDVTVHYDIPRGAIIGDDESFKKRNLKAEREGEEWFANLIAYAEKKCAETGRCEVDSALQKQPYGTEAFYRRYPRDDTMTITYLKPRSQYTQRSILNEYRDDPIDAEIRGIIM